MPRSILSFFAPPSIRSRFVLVALLAGAIAIGTNAWANLYGVVSDAQSQDAIARAIAVDQDVAALRASLDDEKGALTAFLADPDATFVTTADQKRSIETSAIASIRRDGATEPDVLLTLERVERAVAAWWAGYADPARGLGGTVPADAPSSGTPGSTTDGTPVASPAPSAESASEAAAIGVVNRGKALFDNVTAAMDRLAAAYRGPRAILAAAVDENGRIHVLELSVSVLTFVFGFGLLFFFARRWMFVPLARMLGVVSTLQGGGTASFPTSATEIGQLGGELDRMYRAMAADAAANTVVNRFVERVIMEDNDRGVADGLTVALDELMAPDRIAIHVANKSRDRAILQASKGQVDDTVVSLHGMERCPGVRRSVLYPTEDASDRQSVECPLFPARTGTIVHIPLMDRECVGVVHLAWEAPTRYDDEQGATVHRLVDHAALSIANRRMVAGLQVSANTDARTGLLNSRAFDDAVESALRDARPDEPFVVLMFDLDHFKDFNDRFGHAAGDEALRVFSGVLRGQMREGDLVARYGGEEFVAFLRKVDLDGGAEIAERIRRATEQTILAVRPGETSRITVSIGVAAAPGDGVDRNTLVKAADRMLYTAKEQGRNRVATTRTADQGPGPAAIVA